MEKTNCSHPRKKGFETRDESEISSTFLQSSDYQISDSIITSENFSILSFSTNVQFSFEIWIGEIEPVVTDKHEFVCRSTSKLTALFLEISDYQDSDASV